MDLLSRATAMGLVALATAGCVPDLEETASLVSGPRILGVRAEPAEAAPGSTVALDVLVVDPTGPLPARAALDWAFCNDPVPLDRIESVSPRCLVPTADWLVELGLGEAVSGAVPSEACRNFGPLPPDRPAGEAAARPVDADSTGGYYQPVRLLLPSTPEIYATFRARIQCGTPGLTQEQAAELARRSHPNLNPTIEAVSLVAGEGEQVLMPGGAIAVTAGAPVRLRLRWPACPDESACAGAEQYPLFDPVARAIVTRREQLQVSWFTTAGAFDDGRTAAQDEVSTENGWTAPTQVGAVQLWIVLRDDRGGASWQRYALDVTAP